MSYSEWTAEPEPVEDWQRWLAEYMSANPRMKTMVSTKQLTKADATAEIVYQYERYLFDRLVEQVEVERARLKDAE